MKKTYNIVCVNPLITFLNIVFLNTIFNLLFCYIILIKKTNQKCGTQRRHYSDPKTVFRIYFGHTSGMY